jgi:hypothetical protein
VCEKLRSAASGSSTPSNEAKLAAWEKGCAKRGDQFLALTRYPRRRILRRSRGGSFARE